MDLIPGVAHATSTIIVGYPFDTVKTRVQTGMFQSPLSCLRETVRAEGFWALYRGCSVPLCSLLLKRPLEFCIFEELQRRNPCGLPDSWKGFGHGSVAGITGAFVGCPFNVVKVRVQDYKNQAMRGAGSNSGTDVARQLSNGAIVRKVVRDVFLVERSYFRGLRVALFYTIPSASLYLGTYSRLRQALLPQNGRKGTFTWLAGGFAGASASMCTWTIMLPLDTVRTVIQSEVGSTSTITPAGAVAQIVRSRGLTGLWSGLSPVILRSVPSTFVSMAVYETVRGRLQNWRATR